MYWKRNEILRKVILQSGKTLEYVKKKTSLPSALTQIALDFKHSSMVIAGFVKLYHLCQISDTP